MSTTRRTFNHAAEKDFSVFRDGVKNALHAGLYAMAQRGCRVALLAFVSGGIYAGPWGRGFLQEFVVIVNEILTEEQVGYELGLRVRSSPKSRRAPAGHFTRRMLRTAPRRRTSPRAQRCRWARGLSAWC